MEAHFSGLLFRTSLVGVLLGLVATVYLFFGLAGFVAHPLFNSLVAASLGAAALFFLYVFVSSWRTAHWVGRLIWLALLLILFGETLLGLTPPTARDELTHHLAIPKLYARAGRIVEVPIAYYAYYPMLLDMLYTPWLVWGWDFVPKLIHALYGYLTGLLLYAYLARRMNGIYGLLGFFFFIATPVVLRLSHWGYVDLGVTFYTTAALLCLLSWREEKTRRGWLVLAALSLGLAMATKPNGYLVAVLVSGFFLFIAAGEPGRGARKVVTDMVCFGLLTALPLLPWLGKNWLQTGNPFYPLMGRYFHSSVPSPGGAAESFVEFGVFAKRALLYGESGWQIAALPLRLFFFGQDDNPQYFDGALSPLLILLLPWAFKGKWREEKQLLFGFAALLLAFAVVMVDMRARYVLMIVPPLVILLAYAVFNIYLSIKRPGYLYAILIAFAAWQGSYLWGYFREVAPWPYVMGREGRVNFLTRSLAEFPVFQYVNRELPADAKVYLIFVGRRVYYCERDYFHDPGELPGFLLTTLRGAQKPDDVAQALQRMGINHLMAHVDLLGRYLQNNLTPPQGLLWNDFVARHLHLSFQDRGYALYRISR
ncbi:MAG: hypothetical protein FJ145_01030 [Deltaproteobacteria bacterium]|nr:hypothetical protein [Deltaproteobacteria bacterium]